MRVAIVGFGVAGAARLSAYRQVPQAEVVAVVDPSAGRRAQASALDPRLRTLPTLADALDGDASGSLGAVDVVDICAPPAFHAPLAEQAMSAGCHVLCEKPVGLDVRETERMVDRSRRTGRLLYPIYNYVYSPMMKVLTQAADSWLDRPLKARFEIRRTTHAVGTPGWQPDWRRDPGVAGGGILLDHGTHCVYMATRLLGGRPEQVACTTVPGPADDDGRSVEESVSARLDFAGGTCEIELSWACDERRNRYSVVGGNGSVLIDDDTFVVETAAGAERGTLRSPTASGTHEEWFPELFTDFVRHVEQPDRWPEPLDQILSTAQIIEAAYTSAADAGRPLRMR
ncbi:Gfo/Idh/MocA family oxidoreductase [Planotetraspora sp. A-T 1434]|uniref:Gfo/Idh/MocA family protein n=1 Tax=Planotetraspora sp. A-T 1434 TaxID=2979219 RepID=UPI0021C02672|nr:Gfo/Idh/MocA family oxidoreductase [Planotetraspora sp. A-T 1434]MCT9935252.1 Gfo/Idh/MocA family oxidoreductase [Planotetraspora sp. A-T 1434]